MRKITYTLNGMEITIGGSEDYMRSFDPLEDMEIEIPSVDVKDFYEKFPVGISVKENFDAIVNYIDTAEDKDYVRTAFRINMLLIPLVQNVEMLDDILSIMGMAFDVYDKECIMKKTIKEITTKTCEEYNVDTYSKNFEDIYYTVVASMITSPQYFIRFDNDFFKSIVRATANALIQRVLF